MNRVTGKNGIGPEPTEITLLASDVVSRTGEIQAQKPKTRYDENFALTVEYYERTTTFLVPFRVSKNARPGTYTVAVQIYAMVCDSSRCMPPSADTLRCTVVVASSAPGKRQERDTKGSNRRPELDPTDMRAPDWIPGRADVGRPETGYEVLFDNRKRLV